MTYRIRDWAKHFENNRTKELKHMQWVPIPTKLAGDGYTALITQENGPAMYGAWVACVILAASCDPRGTFLRGTGEPHTADSIARITRIPVNIVSEMLAFCSTRLQWIEIIQDTKVPHLPAEIPHLPAEIPHEPALNGREEREETHTEASASALIPEQPAKQSMSTAAAVLVEEWRVYMCKLIPGYRMDTDTKRDANTVFARMLEDDKLTPKEIRSEVTRLCELGKIYRNPATLRKAIIERWYAESGSESEDVD